MNIIFLTAAVVVAQLAVESSFQAVKKEIPTITLKKERKATRSDNKAIVDITKTLSSSVSKSPKKIIKTNTEKKAKKISKSFSYRKVDFTPVRNSNTITISTDLESSPSFTLIKNKKVKLEKVKLPKIRIKKKEIIKKDISIIDFELSLDEQNEQGAVKVQKLKQVAWSSYALNMNHYAKYDIKNNKELKRISNNEKSLVVDNNENKKSDVNFKLKFAEAKSLPDVSEDELIFFNYSTDKASENLKSDKVVDEKTAMLKTEVDVEKSKVVNNSNDDSILSAQNLIISQIMDSQPKEKMESEPANNIKKFNKKKVQTKIKDNVAMLASATQKKTDSQPSPTNAFLENENKVSDYSCLKLKDMQGVETYSSTYKIDLSGIDYSERKPEKLHNFEARFHDDINDTISDYGSGSLNLSMKMNTQLSIRRASFYRKGYYPTTMELVFEAGDLKANIPVLSNESFNSIISENNLKGLGAHLLVEIDDLTEDVEIDGENVYEYKFYLDKNLRIITNDEKDYYYILFVGVNPGNNLIIFKNNENKEITKLTFLAEDEIYYEPNFYAEVKAEKFFLYEESLLSNCYSILNIKSDKISSWSSKGSFKKDSLNKHIVKDIVYPVGMRKYYEFKHLDESIYIGRWSDENIVIPTEKYISYVISQFDLSKSSSKCIVQLNLTKPVDEIVFNGESKHGPMNMQINILDKDGKFYDSFSQQSKRAYLMGEDEGMINIKIDYVDGTSQHLQSFCSDSTYLVEQL